MTTHLGVMALFGLTSAIMFATLMRDDPKEQLKLGLRIFAGFVAGGVAVGWLLYPLPF